MFKQNNQAVMDDDTSGRDHAVHHVSGLYSETHKDATDKGEIGVSEIQHHHHREIGVSFQSHQHKSVPSSSTQPEGTSKSTLDGDEIKNYINKCFAEKMAELVTLISKIPTEVVKALKNEENKQSQEDKIDEQQQSQEDGSNKQERPHKEDMQHEDYDKGSLNDMEVSRDEKSNKQHILEEQQLLDVNAANKEAGREDDFENEDCSDLQALKDVNVTAKEDVNEVNLKNQESTNVTDVQIPPDFPDAQDAVDFDKEEKLKYAFDGYNINLDLPNELMIDYSQCIAVGLLKTHSAKKKEPPIEIQKLAVMLPTYLLDNDFYDKTERTDWLSLEAYKGKITQQTDLVNEIPFDVDYVLNIPQQASDSFAFVCAYEEILSEGLQVHSCGFDAASQYARYAFLLSHYGVEKANEGYTSDNGDPPRPRKSVIEEIDASAIVTLE
ncbi:hypothetical protein CQW23_00638 [Capsicum baccatum]|uniref:Ubiquitin-like protease family profile domain-containing protein n=1 Tax=Capsicum baccatum TaxID=33114 RepID=A0A2G2XLA9_CAPBA|nr:hypothetical protein CQW23_00638 [Capsicum baccatum]